MRRFVPNLFQFPINIMITRSPKARPTWACVWPHICPCGPAVSSPLGFTIDSHGPICQIKKQIHRPMSGRPRNQIRTMRRAPPPRSRLPPQSRQPRLRKSCQLAKNVGKMDTHKMPWIKGVQRVSSAQRGGKMAGTLVVKDIIVAQRHLRSMHIQAHMGGLIISGFSTCMPLLGPDGFHYLRTKKHFNF